MVVFFPSCRSFMKVTCIGAGENIRLVGDRFRAIAGKRASGEGHKNPCAKKNLSYAWWWQSKSGQREPSTRFAAAHVWYSS